MENTGERLLTEYFNLTTIEHLHRYAFALQYVDNKNVVDIASGEGYGSYLLASLATYVTGIDVSFEAVEHSRNKYQKDNLRYIQGRADKIPIESGTIDVVVSFETIEHHDKHQEMINEIKRILKPDGYLIISSPDKYYCSEVNQFKNEFHVKELYSEEFMSLIQANFSNNVFLNQKVNFSSLLLQNKIDSFYEFSGDFSGINKNAGIGKPIFNLAIASQGKIENVFSSVFDGELIFKKFLMVSDELQDKKRTINEILNSKTYKLGKFLLKPFSLIKYTFKKKEDIKNKL